MLNIRSICMESLCKIEVVTVTIFSGMVKNTGIVITINLRLLQPFQYALTLSPQNKLLSAKFLICFNFQSVSILLKVGENVARVTNSLDLGETPSYMYILYNLHIHYRSDWPAKG